MADNAVSVSNRVNNQGVWIGAGFTSENSTAPFLTGQVGQVVIQGGKAYQLVQFDVNVGTLANGTPVMWEDKANYIVTDDIDDPVEHRNDPAGVCLLASTASNYGWIQVSGNHAAVITDGGNDGAAGDQYAIEADGTVDRTAAGTYSIYTVFGVATGTEATSKVALNILVPHNNW